MAAQSEGKHEKAKLKIWRADASVEGSGGFKEYEVETYPGMVVLDAIHEVQAKQEPDLAVRWNCKAGRCGSCSAEINGKPKLLCMTRMTANLVQTAPGDVYTALERGGNLVIPAFAVERSQEFRKCIECFLCQDVCHVLRDHDKKEAFAGPRFMIALAGLDMHPLDTIDRRPMIKEQAGIGYCNITRCCTEVCPEHIVITDNAIIPLKERVADDYYDPLKWVLGKIFPPKTKKHLPVVQSTAEAKSSK